MDLLEMLQGELERAKKDQADIVTKKEEILAREAEVTKEVLSLERVIAAQRRRMGMAPSTQPPSPGSTGVSIHGPEAGDSEEEVGDVNKTQFVRDQIRDRASTGVTPAEIKQAAISMGIECPVGYPYGVLGRLKARKEVVARRGRYFPRDNSPEAPGRLFAN